MNSTSLSRRRFCALAATSASALALGAPSTDPIRANTEASRQFQLIGFTKIIQQLGAEETADFVAEVGWDGVELPVRAKGQIEPERVAEELPKFVEALRKRGRALSIIATDVRDPAHPLTLKVLRTAAELGVKRYRLGFWKYAPDKSISEQLSEIKSQLRDLAQLNSELGLTAGFQNHSGANYVGAPVWDIWHLIRDLDPRHVGVCFDIGHATLEGGLAWPTHARLMEPYYAAVYVKDFLWEKRDQGWKDVWCPLGAGMVNRAFFAGLRKSNWSGPISQHHEYPLPEDRGALLSVLRKDLQVLREWLE